MRVWKWKILFHCRREVLAWRGKKMWQLQFECKSLFLWKCALWCGHEKPTIQGLCEFLRISVWIYFWHTKECGVDCDLLKSAGDCCLNPLAESVSAKLMIKSQGQARQQALLYLLSRSIFIPLFNYLSREWWTFCKN